MSINIMSRCTLISPDSTNRAITTKGFEVPLNKEADKTISHLPADYLNVEGWKRKCSKFSWRKKQIETFSRPNLLSWRFHAMLRQLVSLVFFLET